MFKYMSIAEGEKEDVLPEIQYPHKRIYVTPLRVLVYLRKGKTLKEWLIRFVKDHPMYRKELEAYYGYELTEEEYEPSIKKHGRNKGNNKNSKSKRRT